VFGRNGVDGETWAFYTGVKDSSGEYPIIWITPSSIDEEAFVITNTSFDKFINIQMQYLLKSDNEPELSFEDACNPALIHASEDENKRYWIELYQKYEPSISMTTHNLYDIAVTADKLKEQAKSLIKS
jgi:hypothetical protein